MGIFRCECLSFAGNSRVQIILYYSIVTTHPFTGHPPLPVAEYITSEHTKDSIFPFLNQLHRNLKIICNSTDKPKLIKTDFSLAIIGSILLLFNQVNLQQYLDQCFKVISEEEEMLITFCVPVVCSAHLMRGVKYFVERLKWYHRNKQVKQLILKVLGRLIVCHDFIIIKKLHMHPTICFLLSILMNFLWNNYGFWKKLIIDMT